MKRTKFTELTTVLMMTALCALPLAGQEKVAVKMESAVRDGVQLRADDADALPDSAIRYAPDGQRQTKYVYAGENLGTYTWENNAWKFDGKAISNDVRFYIEGAKYDRETYNLQSRKVSYEIKGDNLYFYIPCTNVYYSIFAFPASMDYTVEYDTNGNLTSFKLTNEYGYMIREFTISFNSHNNPISVELQNPAYNNAPLYKAHYEYNVYEYATLYESYTWEGIWIPDIKEITEYDAQGKFLSMEQYENNVREYKYSYEYYDEHHFSSHSSENYLNNSGDRMEYKYGADGKLGAIYYYQGDIREGKPLKYYYILYPNTLDNPGNANEPLADMRIWSYGGTLHVRTAQPAVLHVYTLTGALHAQQTLPAGETVLPLPPGMYVVRIGNMVRKAVIR
jgi:hypothetical protein